MDRSADRFRSAGGLMTLVAPVPVETTTQAPLGEAVPPSRRPLAPSPLNKRRWQNFKSKPPWLLVVLAFPDPVLRLAVCGVDRQRSSVLRQVRRQGVFPGVRKLLGDHVRRRLRNRRGLSRSLSAEIDRGEKRIHRLAADPLLLRHAQSRSADAGALEADMDAHRGTVQTGGGEEGPEKLPRSGIQLAWHRRPGSAMSWRG